MIHGNSYWKERCLAAENVIKNSILYQKLGDKSPSYQRQWYEARDRWLKLQKQESDEQTKVYQLKLF